MIRRRIKTLGLLLTILILAFASCALPNMPEFTAEGWRSVPLDQGSTGGSELVRAIELRQTEDSITLEWDAPAGAISAYRVYYREHTVGVWTLLDEISVVDGTRYTVHSHQITPGAYDFAVSSVDSSGDESEKHTSLDDDAHPPSGWYVTWDPFP